MGLPPAPRWVPLAFGLWFAAWVGSWAFWDRNRIGLVVVLLVLVVGLGVIVRASTGKSGALPVLGRGTPPPEIGREYRHYVLGCLGAVAAVAAVWWWAGIAAAAACALVVVTAGLTWYAARYEAAAAAVRERLG